MIYFFLQKLRVHIVSISQKNFALPSYCTCAGHCTVQLLFVVSNRPWHCQCPSFAPECEVPSKSGQVNHLIFTSEPLQGENIWLPMSNNDIIGVDDLMKYIYKAKSLAFKSTYRISGFQLARVYVV